MMCVLVSFNNTMIRSTLVFLIWLLQGSLGAKYEGCESPQYLKFGTPGVIECVFHQNFTSIFWYDSTNIIVDEPIVTLINSVRGGRGYFTGEYDISASGSLIITDVVVSHAKNFTVSKFASLDLDGDSTTITVLAVVEGVVSDYCESPQYLEYGQRGTVQCLFQTNFISLLWYNSTDTVVDAPIVTYTPPAESDLGFQSGDFDIFPNGSLVVHKVGLIHELNYTVAKFTDLNEDPLTFVIQVVVTVKSLFEGPLIDICENDDAICFTELDVHSAVNCGVRRVRPIVSLKWMTVTSSGDLKIHSKMSSTMDNVTSTTTAATLGAFAQSPILNLLVCKAEFAPGVLRRDKSLVLVQNRQMNLSSKSPVIKYVRLGSTLELTCGGNTTPYFYVWKRSFPFDNQYDKLMFAVPTENRLETKYSDNFQFEENGSLVIRHVGPEHDGFYGCIYGNGITDGMTKYKVVTYENPIPEYPLVEGCNNKSHCVLRVNREGNLTCSMNGIRPEVKLQWREATEDTGKIAFFDHTTRVTERGGKSNISLTSRYSATSGQEIRTICSAVHELDNILRFTNCTVVILYIDIDEYHDDSSIPPRNYISTLTVVIFVLTWSLVLTFVLISGLEAFILAKKAVYLIGAKRGYKKKKIVIVVLTAYLLLVSFTSCGMAISISAKQIGRTSDAASGRRFWVVTSMLTVILLLLLVRIWGRQLLFPAKKAVYLIGAKRGYKKKNIVTVVLTAYLLLVSFISCGMAIYISAKQIGRTSDAASGPRFWVVTSMLTVILLLLVVRLWGRQLLCPVTSLNRKIKRRMRFVKCRDICLLRVAPDPEENKLLEKPSTKTTPDFESLLFLSKHLGAEWKDVARRLLPRESHVLKVEAHGRDSEMYASLNMLIIWTLTNGPDATYDTLIETLGGVGRNDLAHLMQRYRDASAEFQLSVDYLDLAVPVSSDQRSSQSIECCERRLSLVYYLDTLRKDICSRLQAKKEIDV